MQNLSEEIGRITNILEDAIEEKDWTMVQNMIDALDVLYVDLDKQSSEYYYEE
jgi:RNA binding exosome subunit